LEVGATIGIAAEDAVGSGFDAMVGGAVESAPAILNAKKILAT
jgi:hypothetical protein